MESMPGTNTVLIGASGSEDLLLYHGTTFTIRRRDPTVYHRDIDRISEGNGALLVGSHLPPDTGGTVIEYSLNKNEFNVLARSPLNLTGIDFINERQALITGGRLYPSRSGKIYRFDLSGNTLNPIQAPDNVFYHDVDWSEEAEEALIVGEHGHVLSWSGGQEVNVTQIPLRPLLKTVSWHPNGERALIGGADGSLFRYQSGRLTRISHPYEWTIQDIEWHPGGTYALIVGAGGASDDGYWARYHDFSIESHQLSKPFFSVEWLNPNNALLGGQKVLWRYSLNSRPDDFPLRASLSTSTSTPRVGESLTLSGFGSTFRASADSVASYNFVFDDGDSSGWQPNPDLSFRYLDPGIYNPSLQVKRKNSQEIATDTIELNVRSRSGSSGYFSGRTFFYVVTIMIFLFSTAVAVLMLRW
jgi:hypothetical protein